MQRIANTRLLSFALLVASVVLMATTATAQQVALLEHEMFKGTANSLVRVDVETYALAHRGQNNDGFITTFTISADGGTITEVQSLEHDSLQGTHNSLVQPLERS